MRHSFFFAWPLVGRLAAPGVGLDWADDGLRLVQLSADGALVQAQLAWPSTGVPLDGAGVQLLAESLQQLWQQAGVRQRRVRAALPESMLQRRSLRLPAGLDEAELEALVQAEWQRQAGADAMALPALDFRCLPAETGATRQEVLAVAADGQRLEQLQQAVRVAGLQLLSVDAALHAAHRAALRCLQRQPAGLQLLVLHAGSGQLCLQILQQGRPWWRYQLPEKRAAAGQDWLALVPELLSALPDPGWLLAAEAWVAGVGADTELVSATLQAQTGRPWRCLEPAPGMTAGMLVACGLAWQQEGAWTR